MQEFHSPRILGCFDRVQPPLSVRGPLTSPAREIENRGPFMGRKSGREEGLGHLLRSEKLRPRSIRTGR